MQPIPSNRLPNAPKKVHALYLTMPHTTAQLSMLQWMRCHTEECDLEGHLECQLRVYAYSQQAVRELQILL